MQEFRIEPTPLIGRERELVAIRQMLHREDVRLLTLIGRAGVGKTRLSMEVVQDQHEFFADGVFVILLAQISDAAQVLPALAHSLGIREVENQPMLEHLAERLKEWHMLILLGNFEQVVSAAFSLAELLARCSRLKLLVTSREALHLRAENEFAVAPLDVPNPDQLPDLTTLARNKSVALFLERAQSVKADFLLTPANAATVAQICARLDGLPLALELAAARVKLLPPRALLARLSQRLQVLTGGARDLPPHQQTLPATLAWSYNLLSVQDKRLFRWLSIFDRGCTLEAAQAVCTALGSDASASLLLEGIASLIDKSLLQQISADDEEPRCIMLETVRDYGLECLAACGEDVEHAADLIEQHGYLFTLNGQVQTMLGWLKQLPDSLLLARPRLCIAHAAVLLFSNQLEASSARLLDAEKGIQNIPSTEDARSILGPVALIRGNIAMYFGDIEQGTDLCRQALDLLPTAETDVRASAMIGAARTFLVSGEVTPVVEEGVSAAVVLAREADNLVAYFGGINLLARLQMLQGRLHTAAHTYEQAMQVTPGREGLQALLNSADYYFGMGDLLREWNKLDEAEQHLSRGMDLIRGTSTVYAYVVTLGYIALARLHQARGNYQAALATLHAFTELAHQRHLAQPLLAQVAGVQAQIEVARGNLAAAKQWLKECGLSASDEQMSYSREREYLSLARVRIAQGRADPVGPFLEEGLQLLARLLNDAERKARGGSVIEILLLEALALRAQGQQAQAQTVLQRALAQAEPEAYMRLFLDEGPEMLALLRLAQVQGIAPHYITRLFLSSGEQPSVSTALPFPRSTVLVEPLTERELEVLNLIAAGASNEEIAERLVIANGTVKRHISNIFGKLTVSSRTQAVARAQALGLL